MTDFDKALKALPPTAGYDPIAHKTVEDLCWICLHELDLVTEEEYWLPLVERTKLLKFIVRFGKTCKKDYTDEARKMYAKSVNVSKEDCYINDYQLGD
tara:strand:- start:54 stop:347 length:294 start_codon:yes stop_codon:yes gene_type:complete